MQRNNVLLPEPLRPTIATISPRRTSSETPSSTFTALKYSTTSWTLTMISGSLLGTIGDVDLSCALACDIEFPFESPARHPNRKANCKIDYGDEEEDEKRLKRRIIDDLAGAREFDEAD